MNSQSESLTETQARFYRLLYEQDEDFRLRVERRANHLEERISGDTGECGAWFDEVLSGSASTLTLSMGALPILTTSAAVAKETAAILCQVSLGKGVVPGEESIGAQQLGWNNLNKDAKGWCKALLLAQAPSTSTMEELRDLFTAKLFASVLVDYLLPCASRLVAELDRSKILEQNVDVDS